MKVLESAPSRYDRGIRLLTLGAVDRAYDRLAARIEPEHRVLDLGCGTGALTLRAAQRGATVKGIEVNAQMLDIARERIERANLTASVALCEMGVAELGVEDTEAYNVVTAGLCLSELTEGEQTYALGEAYRVLKTGGLLLIADEVVPPDLVHRLVHALIRLPLAALTYLLAQTTTHAVRNLPGGVRSAGFVIETSRSNALGSTIELVARKPGGRS
jgi:demethylmenaquinone methyltransferase/2-methoxy-6-polyprenyl-1,4-benzoquinol methylase